MVLAHGAALSGIFDELGTSVKRLLSLACFLAYAEPGRSHSTGNLKDQLDSVPNLKVSFLREPSLPTVYLTPL